jgi:rhamnulokinase
MAEVKKYIAVDLGAESGRVMLGSISADKLALEEVHRGSASFQQRPDRRSRHTAVGF